MSTGHRIRSQRILREAEGYLELNLPQSALDLLARLSSPGTFRGQLMYLTGEALRAQDRFAEGAEAFEQATDLNPNKLPAWLGLGWCLKRSRRLDQAIVALQRASEITPAEAIVHYNLACYQSLAGRKTEALASLSRAIELKPDVRDLIGSETDFDPLRSDPDFQALTNIHV